MVYCTDDILMCRRLEEIGCVAIMPLAAPVSSGLGILNPVNIQMIIDQCNVPVLVDAGLGTASDATIAMEMGCDAVLLNTAIAGAGAPILMARAMKLAVEAGRASRILPDECPESFGQPVISSYWFDNRLAEQGHTPFDFWARIFCYHLIATLA